MAPSTIFQNNRRLWDELASSATAGLPATDTAALGGLTALERAEVGPVAGKRLLHLHVT